MISSSFPSLVRHTCRSCSLALLFFLASLSPWLRPCRVTHPLEPSLFALDIHPCTVEAIRVAESMFTGASSTRLASSTTESSQARPRPSNCSSLHWSFFFGRSGWKSNATRAGWLLLALQSRNSLLTTSRAAPGYPMATSNSLEQPSALRNGASPSWTDASAKHECCLTSSVDTAIPREFLPSNGHAPAGPRSSTPSRP